MVLIESCGPFFFYGMARLPRFGQGFAWLRVLPREFPQVVTATRKKPEILGLKLGRFRFWLLECAPRPAQAWGRGLSLLGRVYFHL